MTAPAEVLRLTGNAGAPDAAIRPPSLARWCGRPRHPSCTVRTGRPLRSTIGAGRTPGDRGERHRAFVRHRIRRAREHQPRRLRGTTSRAPEGMAPGAEPADVLECWTSDRIRRDDRLISGSTGCSDRQRSSANASRRERVVVETRTLPSCCRVLRVVDHSVRSPARQVARNGVSRGERDAHSWDVIVYRRRSCRPAATRRAPSLSRRRAGVCRS